MSRVSSSGLRVAYILRYFPILSQTFVSNEIDELRRQGVDVIIFSLLTPKETTVSETAQSLAETTTYAPFISEDILTAQWYYLRRQPVRYLRRLRDIVVHHRGSLLALLKNLVLFPKSVYLARLCEALGVQHVHAHFAGLPMSAADTVATMSNVTISMTIHASYDLREPALADQVQRANFVVVNSQRNYEYLQRLLPSLDYEQIRLIRTGIHLSAFRELNEFSCEGPLILAIGRLIEFKGFKFLLEACRLLNGRGVSFSCEIVGDGPCRQVLEALRRNWELTNVRLIGAVPHQAIPSCLQRAWLLVQPSTVTVEGLSDGLPSCIIEAMATGRPVISTNVSGIPEVVRHGETGLIVPQKDSEALADAINRLLSDDRLRHEMGKRAQQLVSQEFDIHSTTKQLRYAFECVVYSGDSQTDRSQTLPLPSCSATRS